MRIYISKHAVTTAEPVTETEIVYSQLISSLRGQWVDVDTDYTFPDRFAIMGGKVIVMAQMVDGIDFESDNVKDFKYSVESTYGLRWPGSHVVWAEFDKILERDNYNFIDGEL